MDIYEKNNIEKFRALTKKIFDYNKGLIELQQNEGYDKLLKNEKEAFKVCLNNLSSMIEKIKKKKLLWTIDFEIRQVYPEGLEVAEKIIKLLSNAYEIGDRQTLLNYFDKDPVLFFDENDLFILENKKISVNQKYKQALSDLENSIKNTNDSIFKKTKDIVSPYENPNLINVMSNSTDFTSSVFKRLNNFYRSYQDSKIAMSHGSTAYNFVFFGILPAIFAATAGVMVATIFFPGILLAAIVSGVAGAAVGLSAKKITQNILYGSPKDNAVDSVTFVDSVDFNKQLLSNEKFMENIHIVDNMSNGLGSKILEYFDSRIKFLEDPNNKDIEIIKNNIKILSKNITEFKKIINEISNPRYDLLHNQSKIKHSLDQMLTSELTSINKHAALKDNKYNTALTSQASKILDIKDAVENRGVKPSANRRPDI